MGIEDILVAVGQVATLIIVAILVGRELLWRDQ